MLKDSNLSIERCTNTPSCCVDNNPSQDYQNKDIDLDFEDLLEFEEDSSEDFEILSPESSSDNPTDRYSRIKHLEMLEESSDGESIDVDDDEDSVYLSKKCIEIDRLFTPEQL